MSQLERTPTRCDRLYLDNAATQRLRREAWEAMEQVAGALNPAGQYASGRAARRHLEEAREQIAELLGADPVEVVFTGSGTEANNIAIQGLAFGSRARTGGANDGARGIASSDIEHPAVLESVQWLTGTTKHPGFGFRRILLPVDEQGRVRAEEWLAGASSEGADPETLSLITCMWANNETGAIQTIEPLAEFAREQGIPFHTDAVQAVGHVPVDFRSLGAATLAASAHKFGGPTSVGLLLARRDAPILSPVRGGGQERGLRSGTVNVVGAMGAARALGASIRDMEQEAARARSIRDRIWEAARNIPEVRRWTTEPALPGHLHLGFPGAEGDSLIMLLDGRGVDASTGSACSAGVNRASHVLAAMGVDAQVARGALRLTIGPDVTLEDAQRVAGELPGVVEQARAAGMAFG
ncbi:cysteine desulfurase family protein [Corynebacterium heidelbergense]|uniref:cysteine desulfurase family protein n=1 Tax=Corynebacterium heidelbergense TaxID=2055947 RepID=UPI002359833C|nr:cysteine desulfurase family protein [Corynebacterium heidelbergense]